MATSIPETMKAVVFEQVGQWAVRRVPTPKLENPTDLLVKVLACGICGTDERRMLTSVVERTKIQRMDGEVKYLDDDDQWVATPETTPVSMNFWGFTPDYFGYSKDFFKGFLADPKNMSNLKSEFFIPLMVDKLIKDGTATVEVLDTTSKWFGVTYPEDRPAVVAKIKSLVEAGEYPDKLF